MRKLIPLFCLIFLSTVTFADRYVARHQDIKTFLGTTTYVVLEDNPMSEYNFKIKKAVENSWKITPYEFISATEFEEMRNDISKSFLVKLQVKFSGDKLEASYHFLSVVLGAAVTKHTDLPDICSVPLGYSTVDEDSYTYKLESLVRFAQNHIRVLDEDPSLIKANIFQHYNKNRKGTSGKELWLLEKDLDKSVRSLAAIRKKYPNVVFLHKVGPEGTRLQARCYKILIGAGDDQFYYFDYHMISKKKGDGFLASDFKKIK
jgi:hypothetical protein